MEQVQVGVGRIIAAHALHYRVMFEEKPFAEAFLSYHDNGAYRIVSPGEAHYGSYVADGPLDATALQIQFVSWPSADWAGNVADHRLVFNTEAGVFSQHLRLPGQHLVRVQGGFVAAVTQVADIDGRLDWIQMRQRHAAVFDALGARGCGC